MPVSHLGLTVSQIPAATSFYLATLAPLGYRFIGQSEDSIGLGVEHADFFLTQKPRGHAVSPTHIAFSADSRLTVRNCYAAALSSGAHPSGAPSYRDRDCTVFNAAVEDFDGNVIEFVHREQPQPEDATPEDNRVLIWQKDVAESGLHREAESLASRTSRTKSRAESVKTLVEAASRSVRSRSETPAPSLARARTMPVGSNSATELPPKAMFGTILGAAAGAAVAWAMMKSERSNARDEATYAASTRARSATRQSFEHAGTHRDSSTTSTPPTRRRNSVAEPAFDRRYPPSSLTRSMGRHIRAIEPVPLYDDDEIHAIMSRQTSTRRPAPPSRSNTIDAVECAPVPRAAHGSRHTTKRSATMPIGQPFHYIEAAPSSMSRHSRTSARGPEQPLLDETDERLERDPRPTTSYHTTSSRHSPRKSVEEQEQDLKRRDSGISMGSHRSHHSHHSHRSHRGAAEGDYGSLASTLKPSRRGSLQHDTTSTSMPLFPSSKPPSRDSASRSRTSRAQTYVTAAARIPIPESHEGRSSQPTADSSAAGEDSDDGLDDDARTVVPEDSISCVDFSQPRRPPVRGGQSRRSSGNSSKRSDAERSERTARPVKRESSRYSGAALTARSRGEKYSGSSGRRRSAGGYE
ncbi:hypothetical protein LTR53_000852 [Teratosphaeriaceae sp. CCFEE 6253]|nr:hypothetical protein LTR53_000852 [Teratosphaeriaceae sp. CCFEE 6253]